MQNIVINFVSCFFIVKIFFATFVAIVFAIVFVATIIFVDANP